MENASTNEADINCAPGEGGTTPLYAVCSMGNVGMVQLLLDGNADPNLARKKNGETPLYTACDSGRADVARLLLEYHADIDGGSSAYPYPDPPVLAPTFPICTMAARSLRELFPTTHNLDSPL